MKAKGRTVQWLVATGLAALCFGLWVLARVQPQGVLPSLSEILRSIGQLLAHSELRGERPLPAAFMHSLGRFVVLLLGTTTIGIPLGLALGLVPRLPGVAKPIIELFRLPPAAAVLPLVPLVFRGDEKTTLLFLSVGAAASLIPQVHDAVSSVPRVYIQNATAMGATHWEVVRWTVWPLAKRHVCLATIRVVSFLWVYVVVSEYVTAERGLGELIYSGRQSAQMAHVWVGFAMVLGLSFATYTVLNAAVRYVVPWEMVRES